MATRIASRCWAHRINSSTLSGRIDFQDLDESALFSIRSRPSGAEMPRMHQTVKVLCHIMYRTPDMEFVGGEEDLPRAPALLHEPSRRAFSVGGHLDTGRPVATGAGGPRTSQWFRWMLRAARPLSCLVPPPPLLGRGRPIVGRRSAARMGPGLRTPTRGGVPKDPAQHRHSGSSRPPHGHGPACGMRGVYRTPSATTT